MAERAQKLSLFDPAIVRRAMRDSVIKLHPRTLMRNPVMFVVEVVAAVTTILFIRDLFGGTESPAFVGQIAAWLWFTVLFANFAEAVAEGRGKAQADALRRTKTQTMAKRLRDPASREHELVPATDLERAAVDRGVAAVAVRAGEDQCARAELEDRLRPLDLSREASAEKVGVLAVVQQRLEEARLDGSPREESHSCRC